MNFDDTENIFIEGENLKVLKLLQKSYFGKIKMIYIDPPYNTGKDFIYKDNFHIDSKSYMEQTDQSKDGIKLTSNPETSGRFHSDWISFMYARLYLARNLLKDDGVIFVSIDDNEVHNLIFILNEIFGEENQIANIIWRRKRGRDNSAKYFSKAHEYLLLYAKNKTKSKINKLELTKSTLEEYKNPDNDKRGKWRMLGIWSRGTQGGSKFEFISKTGEIFPTQSWLVSKSTMIELDNDDRLIFKGKKIYKKLFLTDNAGNIPETLWADTSNAANAADEIKNIFGSQIFDTPKPIPYLKRMLKISTEKNDLVLDFFAGSGTIAHAVMELNKEDSGNRKYIAVQIPEKNTQESIDEFPTIADICKERIRRVIKNIKDTSNETQDLGFKVFKLAKSNYRIWDDYEGKDTKKLKDQMKLFENPLISKYRDIDVIYECIIKEGFDLNSKIEKITIKPNIIYKVIGEKSFHICLDKIIKMKTVKDLNLLTDDVFICLDSALNDSSKTNISMTYKLKTV